MSHRLAEVRGDAAALTAVSLKNVEAPPTRPLPSVEEIVAAKKLADEDLDPIPKELVPKTGDGQTHLDLIKAGCPTLKKVDALSDRPLPTAEQIAAEKASEGA
jgi:hypothetical protein